MFVAAVGRYVLKQRMEYGLSRLYAPDGIVKHVPGQLSNWLGVRMLLTIIDVFFLWLPKKIFFDQ